MHLTILTDVYCGSIYTRHCSRHNEFSHEETKCLEFLSTVGGEPEFNLREINLSAFTEDEKEKKAGSGGWRAKEGSESTLAPDGSAQRGG